MRSGSWYIHFALWGLEKAFAKPKVSGPFRYLLANPRYIRFDFQTHKNIAFDQRHLCQSSTFRFDGRFAYPPPAAILLTSVLTFPSAVGTINFIPPKITSHLKCEQVQTKSDLKSGLIDPFQKLHQSNFHPWNISRHTRLMWLPLRIASIFTRSEKVDPMSLLFL